MSSEALLLVPVVASAALGIGVRWLPPTARPAGLARLLVAACALLGAATAGAAAVAAWPLVARVPIVARLGGWPSSAVAGHVPVPVTVSNVAAVAVVAVAARGVRAARHVGREVRAIARLHRILAGAGLAPGARYDVADPRPYAWAAPGLRPGRGRPVVSTGLVAALGPAELRAVEAHERAHLRHAHHLHGLVLAVVTAIDPLLGPVVRRARFELERWADEDAAAETDRPTTAAALARAALAGVGRTGPVARGALVSLHVEHVRLTDRVSALLDDPRRSDRSAWLAIAGAAVLSVVALALASHQMEHAFEALRPAR